MNELPDKGDRVRWEHTRDNYRYGTVVDLDGTVGVRTDSGELLYLNHAHLELVEG